MDILVDQSDRELVDAVTRMKRDFPLVNNLNIPIEIGRGDPNAGGFSETLFPGDQGPNGNRESNNISIEFRKQGPNNMDLSRALVGEVMHGLGGTDQSGNPFNQEFFDLKKQFINSLTIDQMMREQDHFNRNFANGASGTFGTDFNQALNGPQADGLIRGALFPEGMIRPDEAAAFRERRMFTPTQSQLIDQMESLLKGKKK